MERKLRSLSKAATTEPYLIRAEEKRQKQRRGKKRRNSVSDRRGRIGAAEKIALAERREAVFPDGVPKSE